MGIIHVNYTEEEIDAVIDALDLGFMRNSIKQSRADTEYIMHSFVGANVVLGMCACKLWKSILDSFKRKK